MLDAAGEQKNQQDNKDYSCAAAWVVTPFTAMRPSGKCPDENEDQNDK